MEAALAVSPFEYKGRHGQEGHAEDLADGNRMDMLRAEAKRIASEVRQFCWNVCAKHELELVDQESHHVDIWPSWVMQRWRGLFWKFDLLWHGGVQNQERHGYYGSTKPTANATDIENISQKWISIIVLSCFGEIWEVERS